MPNIALLSTAHGHTRHYIDNLSQGADGRKAYAIWDDVVDRGQRYAAGCGAKFVPDLDALLKDPAVDAFAICAENTRHLGLLAKALPVGKPVFCEKPLLSSVADLRVMAALLRQYPKTRLLCGYGLPFTGVMQSAAAMLHAEKFGKVTRVKFRNAHHAAYARWFDHPDLQWFFDPVLAGGGAFMDMGTHAVHLLRSLFGPVTEVWATIGNHSGVYPSADDFGIAHLRFASGVLGTVEASWTQTGGIGGLEIVGSERALWNTGDEYVVGAPGMVAVAVPAAPSRPATMDRLVATLQGRVSETELQADLAAILDSVAIIAATYESARTGTWVPVPKV